MDMGPTLKPSQKTIFTESTRLENTYDIFESNL